MQRYPNLSVEEMAAAFARRDRAFDGRFVVGVVTTSIYCRPSCPARRPRPENIRYYKASYEAEQQGFRACKRCRPDMLARDEEAIARALEILRSASEPVTLAELGRACDYSSGQMQRVFKRAVGMSPAAYARALREERAREALSERGEVTGAIYDAGFQNASRFYDGMDGRLGMTPSAWANGGKGVSISWAVVETTLGAMLVAATQNGVCRLAFGEGHVELEKRFPKAQLQQGGADFAELVGQVVAAVEAPVLGSNIPLDVAGTAFQQRVWDALKNIPAGETRSYGQLAAELGSPGASRAVGGANGANPVAVLVPCHRVVQADGSLGGYAWGSAIKEELLRREREG